MKKKLTYTLLEFLFLGALFTVGSLPAKVSATGNCPNITDAAASSLCNMYYNSCVQTMGNPSATCASTAERYTSGALLLRQCDGSATQPSGCAGFSINAHNTDFYYLCQGNSCAQAQNSNTGASGAPSGATDANPGGNSDSAAGATTATGPAVSAGSTGGAGTPLTGCGDNNPNCLLGYIPLEPLPFVDYNLQTGTSNFCSLLNGLFRLLIFIGGLVAIGSLVYAGIMYMASDVVHVKDNSRKGIEASLWGLGILLSSYIILNTINPQLVSCNNALNPVGPTQPITAQSTGYTGPPAGSTPYPTTTTGINDTDWAALSASAQQQECETPTASGGLGGTILTGGGCPVVGQKFQPGNSTTQYNNCRVIQTPAGNSGCFYN